MTKSVTKVQDKDTSKRLSVVRSTDDPTKYWVVILNPDGSKIKWPKGEKWDAATVTVGSTTTGQPWTSASVVNSWTTSAAVLDFTIPEWEKWDTGTISVGTTTTGQPWTSASVTNSWTSTDAVFNFTIPKWDKGDTGNAATVQAGTTTTGSAGTNASVNNSGTTSAAIFDFTIPRGDKGDTWDTGNGIIDTTKDKVWKVTTVTFTYANGTTFDFSVSDGQDWEGAGDVLWPSSSTDGDIVVFDGITGKLIKDSGKTISALETAIGNNTTAISTINGKIPNEATSSNQLADKDFVNSSINSVTAFYITRDAQGDQFATKAQLDATTTFYSGWVVRVPTRNDYCIVVADETHDNATTRYIYQNQWEFQYVVNETALTAQQLAALNSWITSGKVSQYDGYATNKQDALVSGTNIKTVNGTSILGSGDIVTPNTTYSDATQSVAWLMSASDKVKLDWIASGAQVNSITGVKGDAESTYRTGNVNITPANIWITNKAAASGWTADTLVTTGDKYTWDNKQDALTAGTGISISWTTINAQLKVWNLPAIISPSDSVSAEIKAFADAGNVPVLKWELWPYYMYTWSTSWVYTFSMIWIDETTLDVTCVQRRMVYSWWTYTWDMDTSELQQKLTTGTWINISSNQISNTLPFNPWWTATTGYVLTKTADGYEWAAPTGWISLDSNSPITVSKLRVGTEAQYSALGSYSDDTVYMTV